jgi:hypothetical protein
MHSAGEADEKRGRHERRHGKARIVSPAARSVKWADDDLATARSIRIFSGTAFPSRSELQEVGMDRLTAEEERLLADAPRGTYALMLIVAALLFVGWAVLYFGRFLANGPVR